MPTLPPIPEYLIPFIAFIVVPIAGYINSSNLPTWVNRIIVGIIVLSFASLCAFVTHSLSGNLIVSFFAVAAYAYFLVNGPFASLYEWLVIKTPSPLGILAPARIVDSETRHTPSVQPDQRGQFRDPYQ